MKNTLFIWLGANRAKKQGVSQPNILLDTIAKARLPVPEGGILLDAFYHLCLQNQLLLIEDEAVTCPHPEALHHTLYSDIRFPPFTRQAAVRAAFLTTNPPPSSSPSIIQLSVDITQPAPLAEALCQMYTSALKQVVVERRDLLIMNMITAQTRGTAITEQGNAYDQVYTTADFHVDSLPPHQLPKLRIFAFPHQALPPFAQRLQRLLRGVRRTVGKGNWQIEWADDGHICWLLQIAAI